MRGYRLILALRAVFFCRPLLAPQALAQASSEGSPHALTPVLPGKLLRRRGDDGTETGLTHEGHSRTSRTEGSDVLGSSKRSERFTEAGSVESGIKRTRALSEEEVGAQAQVMRKKRKGLTGLGLRRRDLLPRAPVHSREECQGDALTTANLLQHDPSAHSPKHDDERYSMPTSFASTYHEGGDYYFDRSVTVNGVDS